VEPTTTTLSEECRTHNKRFGATAAGRADLKGSAGMPPLPPSRYRQACDSAAGQSTFAVKQKKM